MMKNKKAVFAMMYLVIFFAFIAVTGMFFNIFIYNIGAENIISPVTNLTLQVANDTSLSANMTAAIAGYEVSYLDNEPPWDVFFILTFITFFIVSIAASLRAKKESGIGFFSLVTIGIMFFLLVLGFVDQITTFLIDNLITGVLNFDLSTTPFMNAYFANIRLWSFVWVVLIVVINQFDLDIFTRVKGSVQP